MVTLQQVATLAIPPAEGLVTDGAFHPCGDRALIRTTGATGLFELTRLTGGTVPSIFGSTPVRVPVASEPQGEAVTWALDGRSYLTASETVSGSAVPSLTQVSVHVPAVEARGSTVPGSSGASTRPWRSRPRPSPGKSG